MIDKQKYNQSTGPGIAPNVSVGYSPGYLSVRCATCCAPKGRRCVNKNGLALKNVHADRAIAAKSKPHLASATA